MPTYEYRCPDCEHAFEQFQSITAKSIRKCPQCSGNNVKRLIGSGAGVIFKGNGFYQTDYRSESYQKAAKADKEGASSTKSTDLGSSDGKSGEKTKSSAGTKEAAD